MQADGACPDLARGRFNEVVLRWTASETWVFERLFNVSASMLAQDSIDLVMHGVDTVADIYVNNQLLLSVSNAHRCAAPAHATFPQLETLWHAIAACCKDPTSSAWVMTNDKVQHMHAVHACSQSCSHWLHATLLTCMHAHRNPQWLYFYAAMQAGCACLHEVLCHKLQDWHDVPCSCPACMLTPRMHAHAGSTASQ